MSTLELFHALWAFVLVGALWCVVQYILTALMEAWFGDVLKRGECRCLMCRTTDGFMNLMEINLTPSTPAAAKRTP